jgi:hypothetical protein
MKYKCPEGCEGVTLLDTYYKADENGVVEVPNIPHNLEASGFVLYVNKKPLRKNPVEKTENV